MGSNEEAATGQAAGQTDHLGGRGLTRPAGGIEQGQEAGQREPPALKEGIQHAIGLSSRARRHVKKDVAARSALFLRYMEQRFPGLKTWDALKPSQVECCVRECEWNGLTPDTITPRLKALKMAWRLMLADHPDIVKAPPKIQKRSTPSSYGLVSCFFAPLGCLFVSFVPFMSL